MSKLDTPTHQRRQLNLTLFHLPASILSFNRKYTILLLFSGCSQRDTAAICTRTVGSRIRQTAGHTSQ
ncbi:unnamed protein product [Pleuronectes platessa]|uniref:Uncharacterized protein n=1 Tax=Pleuronectes platessa TaxID=8262 RepID=A0A9N7V5S8_PLEPL|nr:unnamed protein product [Pleuronectes platessa]